MITNINAAVPQNLNYYHISFKSNKTINEDINIYSKKINTPISSMSGEINIKFSKIIGDVTNFNGKINIRKNTTVVGKVSNESGLTVLNQSYVKGDVYSTNGKITVKDSNIDGVVSSKPENIQLQGKNKIKELVLTGAKKTAAQDTYMMRKELANQGIFIKRIGQVTDANGSIVVNTYRNNKLVSTKKDLPVAPFEFRLPKGNIINTIRFDADKPGTLIVERGAETFGRVINGIIKRI